MVGLVLVSHSHRLAEGAAELARQMAGEDVAIETAGGLDEPGNPIGTDAMLVLAAIDRAWSDDGVLVLMDLGSAVLSAEMAIDFLDEDRRAKVLLTDAPLVEGAVAAAVTARMGAPLDRVADEAGGGLAGKSAHLGTAPPGAEARTEVAPGPARSLEIVVDLPHGLHARPAARLVQAASSFDADVRVRNATTSSGAVSARSLNAVATLGVTAGHTIEVLASGADADAALAAIADLAARRFDEAPEDLASAPGSVPPAAPLERPSSVAGTLIGVPASPGFAVGPARRVHVPAVPVPDDAPASPQDERRRLETAIASTSDDIRRQRDDTRGRLGAGRAAIFDAHLLFLQDEAVLGPVHGSIDAGGAAPRAWNDAIESLARTWDGLADPYLRERAGDLRSVGRQVLARLVGVDVPRPQLEAPGILVATDLEPADTVGLDPAVCHGIATARGGPTSHAAVLARALGIPAVVGFGESVDTIDEGTEVGLDGIAGELHVEPDDGIRSRLADARRAREERETAARRRAHEPAVTRDGTTVEVAANVGTPAEVPPAVATGADGIGLFRTEFLFMGRDTMPDEDEQEAAYRQAAKDLDGRPLLVRTLDAGADKPLPYLGQPPEPNPFLGVRGIRLGLARPEVLDPQLRALVRVAADHRVRVMFPMVATRGELREARAALARAGAGDDLEVGIMIEVPSAALTAAHLMPLVDFVSVGTNDLTQYTLAADRGNEHVAALTDALHPAVLMLVRRTADAADAHGAWVGVCGEIAGDEAATSLLLGLGVRELSMAAPAIASVKDAVRATSLTDARTLADRAIGAADAAEVRALLQ